MDPARQITDKLLTLKQAAEILSITVDTLLEWNEDNILKPTITQDGEIGYPQDQIEKFLAIQKLRSENGLKSSKTKTYFRPPVQEAVNDQEIPQPSTPRVQSESVFPVDVPPSHNPDRYEINKAVSGSEITKAGKNKGRGFYASFLVSSFLIITFSLITFLFRQQDTTRLTSGQNISAGESVIDNLEKNHAVKISDLELLSPDSPLFQAETGLNNTSQSDFDKPLLAAQEYRFTVPQTIIENNSSDLNTNNYNQSQIVPLPESNEVDNPLVENFIGTVGTVSGLTSRPNYRDINKAVPDNYTEPLAINLGAEEIFQSSRSNQQTFSLNILFILFVSSLLLSVIYLKSQKAYSMINAGPKPATLPAFANNIQKVLEVDQKIDGSVVLYFLGKEHKLSKPELDSESDQFIERLLNLRDKNVKEIDYDIFEDKEIELNAPLSKLVTRLGFVGLKRELFFPRTSKNRVFFRKYLTDKDLDSMGLTTDQILSELKN